LGRLLEVVEELKGLALVTADHGNADEMYEIDEKTKQYARDKQTGEYLPKTAHTLNPVPLTIVDPGFRGEYEIDPTVTRRRLSNIAATALALMGYRAPDGYDPSLVRFR
jgi:2,3-bisphosphoglycerate-independent phosphoglycerate mutase